MALTVSFNSVSSVVKNNSPSQRTQDSADHITRWQTIHQVRNLRPLLFQILKARDQFFRNRQLRLTGHVHPSLRILDPKGEVTADQGVWRKFTQSSQSLQSACWPRLPAPRTIRRLLKAEIEFMVSNEMYVAACRQHQSYRKAAEELSRQTGQKITKEKVARAVAAMEDS